MRLRRGLLSPTSFRALTDGIKKRHNGYTYCQDRMGRRGERYFRCQWFKQGCKARIKCIGKHTVLLCPHTCRSRPPSVITARIVLDPHVELLRPTASSEQTGGMTKRHEGHLYDLRVTTPNGVRYYSCVNQQTGCQGTLKVSAMGTDVMRAHTCLPTDSGADARIPASTATGVVRKKHGGYLYELTSLEARGVRHYRCAKHTEGCPGLLRTTPKNTDITRQHTCRPAAGAAADPRRDLASPCTFRVDTGGLRKMHEGYLYYLKSTSDNGTRYYRCVQHPCRGGLKSAVTGIVVTRQHTCRSAAGVPDQRCCDQDVNARLIDARPVAAINIRSAFKPVQPRNPPVSAQSNDNDFTILNDVDDMELEVDLEDKESNRDNEEDNVDEDGNSPFTQLQMNYIQQKTEIGELTKQKLQLEIDYIKQKMQIGDLMKQKQKLQVEIGRLTNSLRPVRSLADKSKSNLEV